jgi:formylglycine-generating enzyme required for sulfatase activity
VADYRRCVDSGTCREDGLQSEPECNWNKLGREGHPINCVSVEQALSYCNWERKRLPSEEEWETAVLQDGLGGLGKYAWALERACFKCQKANAVPRPAAPVERGTCAVGSYHLEESKLGFEDLVGNVAEWTTGRMCAGDVDWCSAPVARGNTWCSTLYEELTERHSGPGTTHGRDAAFIGFRCASDATSQSRSNAPPATEAVQH